jgi:hypothetical protein
MLYLLTTASVFIYLHILCLEVLALNKCSIQHNSIHSYIKNTEKYETCRILKEAGNVFKTMFGKYQEKTNRR